MATRPVPRSETFSEISTLASSTSACIRREVSRHRSENSPISVRRSSGILAALVSTSYLLTVWLRAALEEAHGEESRSDRRAEKSNRPVPCERFRLAHPSIQIAALDRAG